MTQRKPEELGFDTTRLQRVTELVNQAIAEGKMPGCVICFGKRNEIAYLQAFGNKRVQPTTKPMTIDTVFDMASVTKPVATGTSIMKLIEQGHLRLSAKVVDYFPEFGANGKDKITLRDLLIHQSGLIPDNPLEDYLQGPEVAWQRICDLDLVASVGTTFKYSDVNFIVLGKLIEKLSGQDLEAFAQQHVFAPLGMTETTFRPSQALIERCAPTEQRDGQWMQGQVHDPRAFELGGIAGHAGMFSTAADLARYASMMLGHGTLRFPGQSETKILAPATVQSMTSAYTVSTGIRGLSWDKRTGYSINRGDLLSDSAYGHGGFTGNVFWIDPEKDFYFIFLSNRLHPDGKGLVNPLAGQILNAVVGAMSESTTELVSVGQSQGQTLTGADVLVRDGFRQLAGQRIGLITNHTGRMRDGQNIVNALSQSADVRLTALFSPEHGFEGKLDIEKVSDSKDAATGLKILSLYGQTRRPTAEMCENVDTLVFDIQDVGCRFYTYISTMVEAMGAANEFGKKFVVLDRPNPIGAVATAGPMLDAGSESFVGFHSMPVRHGMTVGELAKMIQVEKKLDKLELQVIPCENWSRDQYYDQTGLIWTNPSPNMRSLTQALLYPGIGIWEFTNISVGRGTDTPFQVVGAPWIDHQALVSAMHSLKLPGTSSVPIEFTPTSSKFSGELCKGIEFFITDREQFDPMQLGLALAWALRSQHPQQWETKNLNRLLGNQQCADAILAGQTPDELLDIARQGISDFLRRRETFIIYRDSSR
jgi:uncharacterized protein YbbC (DUF1343 family)